uniref:At1g53760 n=1 Tax=Arabidopsis thaliana TaxID=3702 RepID=Q6NQN0_ARATH|nr:At1g53760 [Arabidopsis thaliana]
MRARLVVFPIKGKKWCFSRSVDPFAAQSPSGVTPTTVRGLWKKISSESKPINANAELLVDFISDKMNKAWVGLEKAPDGSIKNKIHGFGLKLLARVKPSEIFLKSISKEVTSVQVTYPPSLDPRLVRRRLRHIAMSGTILHKKYLVGSVTLLPLTSAFMVLPLPNIPFFWVLFRTYPHWRALQGSEKLLKLISNEANPDKPDSTDDADESKNSNTKPEQKSQSPTCILLPSEELYQLIREASEEGLDEATIIEICKSFDLNKNDVLKYRNLV